VLANEKGTGFRRDQYSTFLNGKITEKQFNLAIDELTSMMTDEYSNRRVLET
jgi:hypothetical protein